MGTLSIRIEIEEDKSIGDSIANITIKDDKGNIQVRVIRVWDISELCEKLEPLANNFIDDNC